MLLFPVADAVVCRPTGTFLWRLFGRYFCRQRHLLTGASAVRSHREQQQRARLRQPRLRLQTGRFFPEEEKLGLGKPAETPQLQLPEVSQDISESSVEPAPLLRLIDWHGSPAMDAAAVLKYVNVHKRARLSRDGSPEKIWAPGGLIVFPRARLPFTAPL